MELKPKKNKKEDRKKSKSKTEGAEASSGIRLQSVARSSGSKEEPGVRLRSVLRLQSAEPSRQKRTKKDQEVREKYRTAQRGLKAAKEVWGKTRYAGRVEIKKLIRPYLPRGSVGNQLGGDLGPECSSCDERTKKGYQPAAEYAAKRIKLRRQSREESLDRSVNSARIPLEKYRIRNPKFKAHKETKPFPATKPVEPEEAEEEEPDQPDQDEPDFGGGSDDDERGPGAAAVPIAAAT